MAPSVSGSISPAAAVAAPPPCCKAAAASIAPSGSTWGMTAAPAPQTSTAQMSTCTTATEATPKILPIISSKGRTDETTTSNTRDDFSSMTLCITMAP